MCRQNNKKLEDEAYNIILNTEYEPEFKHMVSSNIIKLLDYVRNSELPKDPSPLVMEMHREFYRA